MFSAIACPCVGCLCGCLSGRVNTTLQSLNLQCNRVTDVGAVALAEALRVRQRCLPARLSTLMDARVGLKVVMSTLLLCVVDDDTRIRFEIMCIVPVLIACLIRHRFRVEFDRYGACR